MSEGTSNLELLVCTSCNKPISPGEKSARFLCPNCGEIEINRCAKCRQFGRSYKCPKCSFVGP